MRMLLVEDDAAIVASLTDLLRSEGYETRCADGQDAAVELLRSERFDLALVDVALAQGNGFAVCAAAKACDPAPAVLFLTASDDEFSTVAGLDMGARLAASREKLGLDFKINGVGGVVSPADYQAYRNAGADSVMSATGAMWDAELAHKIKASR